jgi:hypothetical protein
VLATEVWKAEEEPIGCSAFFLFPDKTTSASHPCAVCTGYCTYQARKYRCNRTYKTAIASIMASPTGTTMVRLKIAPQRGHAVALAEIMVPDAGHDVILVMTLPRASLFVGSISLAADLP